VTDPALQTQVPSVLSLVATPMDAPTTRPSLHNLYRAELGYVMHTCRRMGVADRDLPDVTHDVFVVVHRKLPEYDPARPIRPWLMGIATRVALDHKRLARVSREVLDDVTVDQAPTRSDEGPAVVGRNLERTEARALVQRGLDALDDDKRAVFLLHDAEGLSMPEIAAIIDAPLNTLYSRLRLARAEFGRAVRRIRAVTVKGTA
jgi:RNA polymerase sigma-70 factor (ECF subfamily)